MPRSSLACLAATLLFAAPILAQPCEPRWSKDYPYGGTRYPNDMHALAVYPVDGQPRLFMGGDFGYDAAEGYGTKLGWWDGTLWNKVGGVGPDEPIDAMLVWDDGAGPALYVAGEFHDMGDEPVRYIAKWDGQAWRYMDTGLNDYPAPTVVRCLAVYDDGTGPALYAGGRFTRSGNLSQDLSGIARWDGQHWQAVGGGVTESDYGVNLWGVYALTVYDDGRGPALYAGGVFDKAGDTPVNYLARWDGKAWSAASDPPLEKVPGNCAGEDCIPVRAVAAYDDGTGPALYVGGYFQVPGVSNPYIARYRDGHWEPAGALYKHRKNNIETLVKMLSVQDVGNGPELYVCGTFMTYDPPKDDKTGGCLARWDAATQSWTDLDANPMVKGVTVFDDGSGDRLWACGTFCGTGGQLPGNACTLGSVGPEGWKGPAVHGVDGESATLRSFDDGSGLSLYLGGSSSGWGDIHDSPSRNIVRLNAGGWSPVGAWTDIDPAIGDAHVTGIDIADGGDGPHLYVNGGLYKAPGGKGNPQIFIGVVRWDGSHWSTVGQDLNQVAVVTHVFGYDDGTGRALYFASTSEDVYRLVNGIWTMWAHGNGAGFGVGGIYGAVDFDDGTGPAMWIGGDIGTIEGVSVSGVARYRHGSGWEAAGTLDSIVADFQVWDDGEGPALYMSGEFTHIDGKVVNRVARWDAKAQAWHAVGTGLNQIAGLSVYDDGTGSALWAQGAFSTAGGKPAKYVAKWDGKDWSSLGGAGTDGGIGAMEGANFGNGPTLYMTGAFEYADNYPSGGFAAYEFCPKPPCPADLDGDGTLTLFDFLTFVNAFNASDPAADCDASGALDLFDFLCFTNAFNAGC